MTNKIGAHARQIAGGKADFIEKRAAVARIGPSQFDVLKAIDYKAGIDASATVVVAGIQPQKLGIKSDGFFEIDRLEPHKGEATYFRPLRLAGVCHQQRT